LLPWKKLKTHTHPINLYDLETEKKDTIAGKNGFPTHRNVVLCEHSQKIIRKTRQIVTHYIIQSSLCSEKNCAFFLARPYLLLKKIKKRWPDDRKFPQKITNKSTKTEK